MADNTTLNTGSGGDTIRTEDRTTFKTPVSLIDVGGVAGEAIIGDAGVYMPVEGAAAENAAAAGKPVQIGGRYDATPRTLNDGDVGGIALDADGAVQVSDGGNSLTIDGTVTANLSATDNAVLDQIEVNTSYGDTVGGGVEAAALRVTLASDSTGLLSVDDNGGSLTVDAANDGSFNVTIGDGTNTATIRNLASNDALNVAIVDGSGNQVTSFGGSGGTSATDDSTFTAASGSGTPIMGFATSDTVDAGDVGVLAMDTNRNLKVSIEADNAGIGGGTQYAVDAALGSTPTGTLAIGIRDDALSTLTPVEGDAVGLRVDANGALWVIPSGTTTVSGTVTANLSATDNAVLDQIELNTSYGDTVGGGTEAAALRVTIASDSTGVLSVDDNGGSLTIDNADLTTIAGAVSGTEMQVDVLTMPTTTVTATQLDIDDLAATADSVSAALDTSRIMSGTTALTPQFAVIDAASSGDNTLVAAVAAKKIRVLAAVVVAAGTVTARFESGTSGTALTGQMNLTTHSGFTLPFNPAGWFETGVNTLLNLELSAATSVDGCLVYVEV